MTPRWFLPALAALLLWHPAPARADADEGAKVYQKVLPSVVWIHSSRGGGKLATGTGTLIDRKHRLVLTNFHVVGDNPRATVLFPIVRAGRVVAEREFYLERIRQDGIRGRVVARDQRRDLSLIQLDEVSAGTPALPLSPVGVSPGQTVQSIGNPGRSEALWVYTPGRVRQVYYKKWRIELEGKAVQFEAEVIETDSAINPGDSGGPLVNDKGELVGVTQGHEFNTRLLSTFISASEVKLFLATRDVRNILGNETIVPPRPATAIIRDEAGFFSPDAIKQATEAIRDLAKKYERDLVIETSAQVPASDRERVSALDRAERAKYFRDWARERLRAQGMNGVLILICRQPSYFQVQFSERLHNVFSDKDTQKIADILLGRFKEKKYDEGLLEAVKYVRERFAESAKP